MRIYRKDQSILAHIKRLHTKWISGREADLGQSDIYRVHESILREYRAAMQGRITVSRGLLREFRAEMILCGKIKKELAK